MPSKPLTVADAEALAEAEAKMAQVITERIFLVARRATSMLEQERAGIHVLSVDQVARYINVLAALDRLTQALTGDDN